MGDIMGLLNKIPSVENDFLTYPSGESCELYLLKNVKFEAFASYCAKLNQDGFICVNKNKVCCTACFVLSIHYQRIKRVLS